jgi:hypothetical protein
MSLPNPLEALRAMLDAGAAIVEGVLDDPLMARWLETFMVMPPDDRPVVVDVVEREVKSRVLSRAVEATTGQRFHPNPNSHLYVRVHGPELQPDDLHYEQMLVAISRALRVVHLIASTPTIHSQWLDASQAALDQLDDATRRCVAGVLREMLALVDAPGERAVRAGRR